MEGLTASEMADKLGIKLKTVKKRLEAANIRPLTKEAVYPAEALETIRNIQMGRPKKPPQGAKK
jgi:predicted ArsR family transcriptional regulator